MVNLGKIPKRIHIPHFGGTTPTMDGKFKDKVESNHSEDKEEYKEEHKSCETPSSSDGEFDIHCDNWYDWPDSPIAIRPVKKSDEKEEEFDEWAPGRCRVTPERPLFTPTPPASRE